jgi:RNA polymerase sigma-70 factor (ECF subfamily)
VSDADVIKSSLVDPRSFEALFDHHFRAIYRFLQGRVGMQLAEDLASETFMVAFRRRRSYDLSRDDARPWLYGIATNLVRDHRRAEERHLRAYARMTDEYASAPGQTPEHLDSELSAALLELSHEERSLILLLAWADLTYEQLAHALDVPVGTIRSRVSRVRSKLSAVLMPVNAGVEASGSGLA